MKQALVNLLLGLAVLPLASAFPGVSVGKTVTSYHIGNSLTQGLPLDWIGPWASQRGHTHQAGRHILRAASLHTIWYSNAAGEFPIAPYGSFQDALPTYEFDAVTLQPSFEFPDDVAARIIDFAGLASKTDHIYVFQTWPWLDHGDYRSIWDSTYNGNYLTMNSRDYYREVMKRLPDDTRIIPTGEVLYELAGRIDAGTLPGIDSIEDLFQDDACTCHFSEFGMFAMASTVYATLFEESPVGFHPPVEMSAEAGRIMQEVAWAVASNHVQTGLAPTGDFDADGEITLDDYAKWKDYYRKGISEASGYTVWRDAYENASTELPPMAVPEPAAGTLLVISLAIILDRCRFRPLPH